MIQSMTGYGAAEYSNANYNANLEIKGYNNRYLEIIFSFPETLGRLEEEFRSLIKQQCTRGRLEIQLNIQSINADVSIDPEKLRALKEALGRLKKTLKLSGRVKIDHLLGFNGFIRLERPLDPMSMRPLLHNLLEAGLADFVKNRHHNGEETVRDILSQLDRVSTGLREIQTQTSDIEGHINARLVARFEEVLGNKVDEERVLTELAVLLVKHSISEEISRLQAYILHIFPGNSIRRGRWVSAWILSARR